MSFIVSIIEMVIKSFSLALMLFALSSNSVVYAEELKSDLIAEAIPKLTELKSYLQDTEIKGVLLKEYRSKSKVPNSTKTSLRYLNAENAEVVETKSDSDKDEMKVVGFNPAYAMILSGQKGTLNFRLDHLSGKAKKEKAL